MRIAFKDSVRFSPWTFQDPRFQRMILGAFVTAPPLQGDTLVITSIEDGTHSAGSVHKYGLAIDVRFSGNHSLGGITVLHLTDERQEAQAWRDRCARYLGNYYDVILEEDHIHIEWDDRRR